MTRYEEQTVSERERVIVAGLDPITVTKNETSGYNVQIGSARFWMTTPALEALWDAINAAQRPARVVLCEARCESGKGAGTCPTCGTVYR